MDIGDSAFRMAHCGGGPPIEEGGPQGVFQLQRDPTTEPPGKVYSRVLERRVRPIVEPRI